MKVDRKTNEPATGAKVLLPLVRENRRAMVLLAVTSFAGALLEAAFLVLLTGTVLALASSADEVASIPGVRVPIDIALIVSGVAIVIRLAINLLGVRLAASLVAQVTTAQRSRLSNAFLGTSWSVQQAEPSGKLQELLTSFVGRVTGAATAVTQAVTASLSLVAFLGTGVAISPLMTLGVLLVLAVLGGVLAPLRRRIRSLSRRLAGSNLEFAKAVSELGGLGQEMHSFGAQRSFSSRIASLTERTTEDNRRVQVASGTLSPVYTFLAYVAVVAAMFAMRTVGVGDLAAIGSVMLLMLRSLSYAQQLQNVSGQLANAIPFIEDLNETVRGYEANRSKGGDARPDRATPIELHDVTYSYTPERLALAAVGLTINEGEILGVIGPSGAGKSTLAQLLLGLRDPTMGTITVDGTDLREVDRAWWTKRMAFVPQSPLLFTGTVAENIRFFRTGLSDEALTRAAEQANVLADVQQLPDGFATHLGERGGQLSGGQQQRLSIARALVGQPELLIMDEPTSALDGKSEALIRKTMEGLHGQVTMVVIAHRMSTLDLCDRIAVIEGGKVTGLDAPDQLRRTSPFYSEALQLAGMSHGDDEEKR